MGWCMLAACLLLAAYRRESWGGTRFISGGEPYRDSVYGIIRPPRATPCTLNPLSRLPCLPVWLHCQYPERGTGAMRVDRATGTCGSRVLEGPSLTNNTGIQRDPLGPLAQGGYPLLD